MKKKSSKLNSINQTRIQLFHPTRTGPYTTKLPRFDGKTIPRSIERHNFISFFCFTGDLLSYGKKNKKTMEFFKRTLSRIELCLWKPVTLLFGVLLTKKKIHTFYDDSDADMLRSNSFFFSFPFAKNDCLLLHRSFPFSGTFFLNNLFFIFLC
jgi:hypothetical protein